MPRTPLLLLLLAALPAAQGSIQRVSLAADGTEPNTSNFSPSVAAGGDLVVFVSRATTLHPAVTVSKANVYAKRLSTGEVEWLSGGVAGIPPNFDCLNPAVSADGRYVVFQSRANTLVPGDTNNNDDIFLVDRELDTTVRVTQTAAGGQGSGTLPDISADGDWVVFRSTASNLAPGDTNGQADVLIWHRPTGAFEVASLADDGSLGNGPSGVPSVSEDGNRVCFGSNATNLVGFDTNGKNDIFVRDRGAGTTVMASSIFSFAGNNDSTTPEISDDGNWVAFESRATNLAGGNGKRQVLVKDLVGGGVLRATKSHVTTGPANDESANVAIGGDGRFIAFSSLATDLAPNDTNGTEDVFVYDRIEDETLWISRDLLGNPGDNLSGGTPCSIAPDGPHVAFRSFANNLVPGDTKVDDVFLRSFPARAALTSGTAVGTTVTVEAVFTPADGAVFVGAASLGFSPSFDLDGVDVPLVPDALFLLSLSDPATFSGFSGLIAGPSKATLSIAVPDQASLAGLALYVATIVFDGSLAPLAASNPVEIVLTP